MTKARGESDLVSSGNASVGLSKKANPSNKRSRKGMSAARNRIMNLVIVESPSKAKTLRKFLGSGCKVSASVGHVRDLPKSRLGIDIENDFAMRYMTVRGKKDVIDGLRTDVKRAGFVYLATDPDREGEAIAWHLSELLHLDPSRTRRITFNEVTRSAVENSVRQARGIDMNLVDAQQTRRALDRIVGYTLSPILWRKVRYGLSAGRVQSVALRIICDRERERRAFVPKEYWTVGVTFEVDRIKFVADFWGTVEPRVKIGPLLRQDADRIVDFAKAHKTSFEVYSVKKGSRVSNPKPPFVTSTLQQEAYRSLGFKTDKTMRIAQELYEGVKVQGEGMIGLISYIRTDSTRISSESYEMAKSFIINEYGDDYLPSSRPVYKTKNNIQDAHEAIRPTDPYRLPDVLESSIGADQYKLYKLIWRRFIASQMAPAVYGAQLVEILNGDCLFKTTGSILKFDGYLRVCSDDQEKGVGLPSLEVGDVLKFDSVSSQQHFTQPPARFTDASLVKILEELGIGRPSTYSSIITNIRRRSYVTIKNKCFCPTELGEVVENLLVGSFGQVINVNFTSQMESLLDRVASGDVNRVDVLKNFYFPFYREVQLAESKVTKVEIADEPTDVLCEKCGRNMVLKMGKYGKFLACPGFPDCKNSKPYFEKLDVGCPKCGRAVLVKRTRKGSVYYACEGGTNCGFMSWLQPLGEFCPQCGSYMLKKSKNRVCSDPDCGYSQKL